ncbi:MAG TPA: ATP-binding protein, partial [bacterium]|nr:ATP-binding protein [bacterium]
VPHPSYLHHLEELRRAITSGDGDKAIAAAIGLEQVAKLYRTLLEQANDAILILEPESGRILDWNSRAETLLVHNAASLANLSLWDLCPASELPLLRQEFDRNRINGNVITYELSIICGDGTQRFVDSSSSLIEFGGRSVVQAILRDVSERVRLKEEAENYARELEDKNEELARAQRLKSEFLASMSHDLLTPVEAIQGDCGILLDDELHDSLAPSQRKIILHKMENNASHLRSLIARLLELSRLEAGAVSVLNEDVDLVSLVHEEFEPYRSVLSARGLRGDVLSEDRCIVCRTDPVKLGNIVRVLIGNAAKFTERGEVTVSIRVDGTTAVLAVRDTGIGIEHEYLEDIFGIFRTHQRSFTRRDLGPALGLSMVKKFSDLLGVQIGIETQVGRGTVFTLRLPGTVLRVQPFAEESGSSGGNGIPDALVVDDDRYTVEMLSEFLECVGHCRVRKAYSGVDAQLRLTEQRPDFLFVDLMLPQINGERILHYCENMWGKNAVTQIVVTGKILTSEERRRLLERAAAVIDKRNLRTDVLRNLLSSVLNLDQSAVPAH